MHIPRKVREVLEARLPAIILEHLNEKFQEAAQYCEEAKHLRQKTAWLEQQLEMKNNQLMQMYQQGQGGQQGGSIGFRQGQGGGQSYQQPQSNQQPYYPPAIYAHYDPYYPMYPDIQGPIYRGRNRNVYAQGGGGSSGGGSGGSSGGGSGGGSSAAAYEQGDFSSPFENQRRGGPNENPQITGPGDAPRE